MRCRLVLKYLAYLPVSPCRRGSRMLKKEVSKPVLCSRALVAPCGAWTEPDLMPCARCKNSESVMCCSSSVTAGTLAKAVMQQLLRRSTIARLQAKCLLSVDIAMLQIQPRQFCVT